MRSDEISSSCEHISHQFKKKNSFKFLNHICIDLTIADHIFPNPFRNPRHAKAAPDAAAAVGLVAVAVADA